MGGVTINVQVPVFDDSYPSPTPAATRVHPGRDPAHERCGGAPLRPVAARLERLRSRRPPAARADVPARAGRPAGPHPAPPAARPALKSTVTTDIPVNQLAPLLGLASQVDTKNIRSYVFSPPLYATDNRNDPRGDMVIPKIGKIRAAVKTAFTTDPAEEDTRQNLAEEGAQVWVLNGTSDNGRGAATRRLPRLPRPGRVVTPPAAGRCRPVEHVDRRLQRCRGEAARYDRVPRADVRGPGDAQGRSRHPGGRRHHGRQEDTQPRGAALVLTRRGPWRRRRSPPRRGRLPRPVPYSIAVSQWAYSGSRPRTASK